MFIRSASQQELHWKEKPSGLAVPACCEDALLMIYREFRYAVHTMVDSLAQLHVDRPVL
jgi:hypothetical protein